MKCPYLGSKENREIFEEMKQALGEDLAYLVVDRNDGNLIHLDRNGQESQLFTNLLRATEGDRIKAIQMKASIHSFDKSSKKVSSKIKYDYSKPASEQDRAARNNALIDITYGVLQNPNTLKDFINPGGFDTLSDLADKLKTIQGKNKENLNFFSLITQNALAERNMTGKQLVGVAANHNKNHAMRLWTKLALKSPVKFDNDSRESLHDQKAKDGTPVSKNLAEFLAAIVDNAKDPVAAFINYNVHTADIMSMLVSTGYSLDTVVAFMNQPVILQIVEDLKAAPIGGDKQVLKKWATKYGIKYTNKTIPEAENLNTDELWENMNLVDTNVNYYEGNIVPEKDTIFVFGSNPEGRHGAGAAKVAVTKFGAKYGQGEGLQGNAYALPTKDLRVKENKGLKSISPKQIIDNIKSLYEVARQNPNKQFKVAYRNTTEISLNGYTGLEMIDMFNNAGEIPSNIIFSKEWVDTGNLNISKGKTNSKINKQVVASFIRYREVAKDFSKLIRAMRSDTQGGAAGPTMSDNIKTIETIESVLDKKKTKYLSGVEEVFSENSSIPYLQAFAKNGIFAANNMLNEFFPNNKKAFKAVRAEMEKYIDRDLSVKEIENLNSSLITYIYSQHSFYKVDNRDKFIKDIPDIIRLLQKDEKFKSNTFAKYIQYRAKDRKSPIPYLSFDNTKNYSPEHRQMIIDGFYDMLRDDSTVTIKRKADRNGKKVTIETDIKLSDLAKDLIRYSYFSSGFNFGPNSFFQLVPVEFYTEMEEGRELVEFTDKMLDEAETTTYRNFTDQYFRNNYKKSNLVPVVEKNAEGKYDGFIEAKVDNLMILRTTKETDLNYKNEKGFKPFIRISQSSNDDVLLRYDSDEKGYVETHKLGIPNILTEYDYNEPHLTSAVNKNNITRGAERGYSKDPNIQSKLFNGRTSTNMVDMLGRIAYSDHILSPLAMHLLDIAKEMRDLGVEVPVDLTSYYELSQVLITRAPAAFLSGANKIVMTSDGLYRRDSEVSALHETMHAMTEHLLESNKEIVEDFTKMWNYAKENSKNPSLYAWESVSEFAAELMTNGELVRDLKSIPPTEGIRKYDNLFQEIVDKILTLLGLNYGNTAYEQATSILSHVVTYGKVELYNRNVAEARRLEVANRVVSPTGNRYYMSLENASNKAKELNTTELKGTNYEASSIKFVRETSRGPKEVFGVAINPKNISTSPEINTSEDIMHESELELAFAQISDQDAEQQRKICEGK